MEINENALAEYGFEKWVSEDKDNDVSALYVRNGVYIYKEAWEEDSFTLGTEINTEDQNMQYRSGRTIPSIDELKIAYRGLTGAELTTITN